MVVGAPRGRRGRAASRCSARSSRRPCSRAAVLELGRWVAGESLSSLGLDPARAAAAAAPRGGARRDGVGARRRPRPARRARPELWTDARREDRLVERLERERRRGARHRARPRGGRALGRSGSTRRAARQRRPRGGAPPRPGSRPPAGAPASWSARARRCSRRCRRPRRWPWSTSTMPPTSRPAPRACTRATSARARGPSSTAAACSCSPPRPSAESWWRADARAGSSRPRRDARPVAGGHHRRHARHPPEPAAHAAADARHRGHARRGGRAVLVVSRRAVRARLRRVRRRGALPGVRRGPGAHPRPARARAAGSARAPSRRPTPARPAAAIGSRRSAGTPSGSRPRCAAASRRLDRLADQDAARPRCSIGTPAPAARARPGGRSAASASSRSTGCCACRTSAPASGRSRSCGRPPSGGAAADASSSRRSIPSTTRSGAVQAQDRASFYEPELKFRAELGYPPFRRLAVVSAPRRRRTARRGPRRRVRGGPRAASRGLTVYPPAGDPAARAQSRWRFVVKGPAELPRLLAPALEPFLGRRRRASGMVDVEMDPRRTASDTAQRGDGTVAVLTVRRYGDPVLRQGPPRCATSPPRSSGSSRT